MNFVLFIHSEEPSPSADGVSAELLTPSTPDSSFDLATREKICTLDKFAGACPYAEYMRKSDKCREGDDEDLGQQLRRAFQRNCIPFRQNVTPSKRLLFTLRDKLEGDLTNMSLQLPAKKKEFLAYSAGPGSWTSDDVNVLLQWARQGRKVAGKPPQIPLADPEQRLSALEIATEKMRLRVAREQRLSNKWRSFLSRFKVLERRPQVSVDVEGSLLRKKVCWRADQFALLHAARIESDIYFKTMLGSLRDSGALNVILIDFLEKKTRNNCLPAIPELMYWLVAYVTVLSDGSLPIPCDPLKEHGHPTDVVAQMFQLTKCLGPDILSDLAKLRVTSMQLMTALTTEDCQRPFESTPACDV
ncbi:unnamed protein product [Notodromas monacha]|uniref:Uncharacterized protein n=1 Tax=Notodromas monacha TaxID=399045 RepID=A0A7R9BX11_9CRUS|nr:unnamed protein product [Notodromas monacha]CAG0922953.1 unnamed protein product [Notodromas monacha]